MDLGLSGLRAVVNGGTQEAGGVIVASLAAEGAAVASCARNADNASCTVSGLRDEGRTAFGAATDVADPPRAKAGSPRPRERPAASVS